MNRNSRFMVAAFALLVLAASAVSANAQEQEKSEGHKILGAWLFNVTVPPGTPGPPMFLALDSFAPGGGWSGHASTDSAANWSPAYGTWKHSGNHILITQYQFSQDSTGVPTGLVIIHKEVHFTGPDSLKGKSSVDFCDLNGANCFSPPVYAHVTAVRIEASAPSLP